VNKFIDHLKVVTTNNYNVITISTIYSSLDNSVLFSVTGRFLAMALTMIIPLPPAPNLSLFYNISIRTT
jgi:hypothetical protein